MTYNDDPPATFPCGHARSRENLAFNGGHPKCKQCTTAYHKAYNKAYSQIRPNPSLYPSTSPA